MIFDKISIVVLMIVDKRRHKILNDSSYAGERLSP